MDKRETLLGPVIILHSDQYNSVLVGKASASHALDIIQVYVTFNLIFNWTWQTCIVRYRSFTRKVCDTNTIANGYMKRSPIGGTLM